LPGQGGVTEFATNGNTKANLDQIRNGTADGPVNPASWVNGNAGASQAHYNEGHSIGYRISITGLSAGAHFIDVEWDIRANGKSAIDYITSFQRLLPHIFSPSHSPETVDPTIGFSGLGAPTTFPIPAPSSTGSVVPGQPTSSFNNLPAGERVMTIYSGTITNLAYLSQGSLSASSSATRMRVSFNATGSTVVL